MELYHTICDECGTPMNEGYVVFGGEQYYCKDECLHKHYTKEEWENEMYDDDGDSYWTEWEQEDANYKLVDGQLIEIDNPLNG